MVPGGVRAWCLRCPPDRPGGPQRSRAGARSHHHSQWLCSPSSSLSQPTSLLRVSLLLPAGCLAEQWSGKKGDTAALGGKKSKKKSGRAKALGGGSSKQRKELGDLDGDPSPEEDEGIQKASPLTHSPPDEL